MKKIKMFAIGNENKYGFNYYIFEKTQDSFEKLSALFYKILGLSWDIEDEAYHNYSGRKILVKSLVDVHNTHFSVSAKKKGRLDIFYGNKKMFVSVVCSEKQRLQINEELFKITKIIKYKK